MKPRLLFFLTCLILFLASLSGTCQALNYFVDGSRWVYQTTESTEPNMQFITNWTEQFEIQGDTILNLVNYKKLYNRKIIQTIVFPGTSNQYYLDSYDSSLQYIRYDSTFDRVYYRTDTSTSELLAYSFNPGLGDTMNGIYSTWYFIVDSIEPINIFGVQDSKYYLSFPPVLPGVVNEENYLLNGIGGSNGLLEFHPVEIVVSGGIFMTRLVCFQYLDSVLLGNYQSDCPYINFPNSITDAGKLVRPLIYPDPFSDYFTIQLSRFIENGHVDVFDTMGKLVYSDELNGKIKSVQCTLPHGIYFVKIVGSGVYFTEKLIRE